MAVAISGVRRPVGNILTMRSSTNGAPVALLIGAMAASCGGKILSSTADADAEGRPGAEPDATGSNGASPPDATEDRGPNVRGFSGDSNIGAESDGMSCFLDTSRYDQSCSVDSDCIAEIGDAGLSLGAGTLIVQSGDYCRTMCLCPTDAISRSAVAEYVADVARTPLGSGSVSPQFCNCGVTYFPCCLRGHCVGACYTPELYANGSNADTNGDVPCGLQSGPLDGGGSGIEPFLVCRPPESCQRIGGGWGCCSRSSAGDTCYRPGAQQGGP